MPMKDYYALLGLEGNATQRDIKKNYRKLATKFHPDKSSDPSTAATFIAITEAYDVLADRKSRAAYDLKRWEAQKSAQEAYDSFTTVVAPKINLRTRRHIAQQKRGAKFQQTEGTFKQYFRLLLESLHIVSRYIIHVLGVTIFGVILASVISQLSDAFELSYFRGAILCLFIALLAYGIFKIIEHLYIEFGMDVEEFSRSYRITKGKASLFAVLVFGIVLLIYISIIFLR